MNINIIEKDILKEDLKMYILRRWFVDIEEANDEMIRIALAEVIKNHYVKDNWIKSKKDTKRKIHYFSMEFMTGKQLKTNLINLGKLDLVREVFKDLNIDFNKVMSSEIEPKIANGGLGRLAFAIMNGTANMDKNACGNGLLYKEGIFEQHFIHGKQIETQDFWFNSEGGHEWINVQPQLTKVCKLYGEVKTVYKDGKVTFELENYTPVKGIVHELPIIGFNNDRVNTDRKSVV